MSDTDKKYHKYKYSQLRGSNDYDNEWKYDSFLSSYNWADTHEYYELPANGRHRWNFQSFFSKVPSWDNNMEDGYEYRVEPTDVTYRFGWDYLNSGENANITHEAWEPKSSDSSFDFGVSIGPSFGPVSAGMVYSYDDDVVEVKDDPHNHIEWNMDLYDFPASQDDTRGVYLDVAAGGNLREESITAKSSCGWEYWRRPNSVNYYTVVYSDSASLTHYPTPNVVQV